MANQAKRVVCTGIGLVSPLGIGASINWSALLEGKSGVSQIKDEHSFSGNPCKVAAYVPEDQLADALDCGKHRYIVERKRQMSRATKFCLLASHEALEDAELTNEDNEIKGQYRERLGVAIGQGMVDFEDIFDNGSHVFGQDSYSGQSLDEAYLETTRARKISPYFMTRVLVNMAAGNVSIRYKTLGLNHCVSTACATGLHSIGDAFNFIKNGQADIMICGSTEAPINKLSIAGFSRLNALCTKFNESPTISSRPFDNYRSGFVMGEGAGILILESYDHALSRYFNPEKIYAEILGYGCSSDGYHLTAPLKDGGGAMNSMKRAIESARINLCDIGHINAHATSTPLGDEIEAKAIEALFCKTGENEETEFQVNSCKGSIGHLLGSAGSVESIFTLMACNTSTIPQSLNLDTPLATPLNKLKYATKKPAVWNQDRRIALKNSFGFGGTNASLIISNFIK